MVMHFAASVCLCGMYIFSVLYVDQVDYEGREIKVTAAKNAGG